MLCSVVAFASHAGEGEIVRLGALTVTGKLIALTPPPAALGDDPPVRYYPERAQTNRIEADVTLRCKVVEGGATVGCRVKDESVKREGFGEKALLIWSRVNKPVQVGGQVWNAGTVLVPIRFRMEKPE